MSTHVRTVIFLQFLTHFLTRCAVASIQVDTIQIHVDLTHLTVIRYKLKSIQCKLKSFRRKSKLEELLIPMKECFMFPSHTKANDGQNEVSCAELSHLYQEFLFEQ